MNLGKLDRLVTLQQPETAAQNTYGEEAPQTWADAEQVWARIEYPAGTEPFQADQKTAVQPAKITLRYRPDLDTTWRVAYEGKTYHLTAVAEIGRRAGLILTAFSRGTEPGF